MAATRMVGAIRHRGPDDQSIRHHRTVSVGATRLAIQDLSRVGGRQPMVSDDGLMWIVYNGEMYNAAAERRHLLQLGYTFRSTSDTEVVLALFRHYGPACLTRIHGIFALAVVDFREDREAPTVYLARDPLGVKPLLYHAGDDGVIVFGSELKTVLASGLIAPVVEPRALHSLLSRGAIRQPDTMIRGVTMLPPAHYLLVRSGEIRSECYWRLGADRYPELRFAGYDEQTAFMAEALRRTLRSQLVGDVPIGALLSGGVDSATLTALMAGEAGHDVRTFSVGFPSDLASIDETELAGRIARHLGTRHTRIEVDHAMLRAEVERIVDAVDQPSIDGINTYFVSRAASEFVKVAISGTGGDDLFLGYPWHTQMLRNEHRVRDFLASHDKLVDRFHDSFTESGADSIIAPNLLAALAHDDRPPPGPADELASAGTVERLTALTIRGYTKDQLLRDIDAMSMAHSLEIRVPYLDTRLIDVALSLPIEAKLANGAPDAAMTNSYRAGGLKRILIDIARPLLPAGFDDIAKRGFGMPLTRWLNRPLRDLVTQVLEPTRVAAAGLLNPQTVAVMQRQFAAGKVLSGGRLWLAMSIQLWAERRGVRPAA